MRLEIGQKIKGMRLSAELTQAELAARASLSKGFISQIEHDNVSISLDSLVDILDALGSTIVEFFSEGESPKVVFSPKDRIPVSGRGASRFEILVAGSTNNEMDPFFVRFVRGESFETEEPHVGEEFGFVLSGALTLELSGKKQKVLAKSCFYFESNQPHRLLNTSERDVSFIWVTAPPQM